MVSTVSGAINPAQNIPAPAAAAKQAEGNFAKASVIKLASPSQALADMQEEISFAHSEKTEHKSIEEYECEDFHDHLYVEIVEQIQKEYPPDQQPQKDNQENFVGRLRERPPQSHDDVLQMLGEITEDQAEGFAILNKTANHPPDDLPANMVRLLRESARDWVAENAPALIAGANTISLARADSGQMDMEAAQLQKTYQDMVTSYEGILPALTKITADQGVEKFEDMTGFLMRAADKDLAATRSSVQPERIKRILAEFQAVKIFNTLREWSNKVFDRFAQQFKAKTSIKPNDLFARCLNFISAPESFNSQILTPIRTLTPTDKVLVLQGLRNGVRNLPDYLFASGQKAKSRILFPVQNEIDQLVFEQDA